MEVGSIADWVVGISLLFFTVMELIMHYKQNKKELVKPQIRQLVREVLPRYITTLKNNDDNARGANLIFRREPEVGILAYGPEMIDYDDDARILLKKHTQRLLNAIDNYNKLMSIAKQEYTRFITAAEVLLTPFIDNLRKNTNIREDNDTLLQHSIGIAFGGDAYKESRKQWNRSEDIEKVRERNIHQKLLILDASQINRVLENVTNESKRLQIMIETIRENLAENYGIDTVR